MGGTRQIVIEGNSGAELSIIHKSGSYFVRKKSTNEATSHRLKIQAEKQKEARKNLKLESINIPLIDCCGESDNGLFFFDMEYAQARDCITFLQFCSKSQLEFFIEKIVGLIEQSIETSTPQLVDRGLFNSKLKQTYQRIDKNDKYGKNIEKIYALIGAYLNNEQMCYTIPVGSCHGDLTLSNILVSEANKEIYLIDFLNCYLESPLQDIAKLRQDTYFFWSSLFYKQDYDQIRMLTVLKHLDKKIDTHFSKYPFYTQYYKLFQLLNMFRLLPYAKTVEVKRYVIECLFYLLGERDEFNYTSCW